MKYKYSGMDVVIDPASDFYVKDKDGTLYWVNLEMLETVSESSETSSEGSGLESRLMTINEDYINTLKLLAKDKLNGND